MSEGYDLSGNVCVHVIEQIEDNAAEERFYQSAIRRFFTYYRVLGDEPQIHRNITVEEIKQIIKNPTNQAGFVGVSAIVIIISSLMRDTSDEDIVIQAKDGTYSFQEDIVEDLAKTRVLRGTRIPLIFLLQDAGILEGCKVERSRKTDQFYTDKHDIYTYRFPHTGFKIGLDPMFNFIHSELLNLQPIDTHVNILLIIFYFLHNVEHRSIADLQRFVLHDIMTPDIRETLPSLPYVKTTLTQPFCSEQLRK